MSGLADGQRDDEAARQVQRQVDRTSLRFYVQQAIFCQVTRRVLDVRRAVALRAEDTAGRVATVVMTADAWDANREKVLANAAKASIKTEVLDGRELHRRTPQGGQRGKHLPVQQPPQSPHPSGPVPRA
jgi:hypothetical protein